MIVFIAIVFIALIVRISYRLGVISRKYCKNCKWFLHDQQARICSDCIEMDEFEEKSNEAM